MALVRQAATSPKSTEHTTPTDSGSASQNVPITKSKFWFDTGDVVLQVQNTHFRVHSFLLSRNSIIFANLFEDVQRPSSKEDDSAKDSDQSEPLEMSNWKDGWVDGCPLIYLADDRASDFEHLMSILYDNLRDFPMRTPMPLNQCGALIRLGKKYVIQQLLDEGLHRFYTQFPSEESGWDKLCEDDLYSNQAIQRLRSHTDFYEQALALAHEFSLMRALPAICLSLVMQKNADEILKSLKKRSPNNLKDEPLFPPSLLRLCLAGRDKILCGLHKQIRYWIFVRAESPIPAVDCGSPFGCTPNSIGAIGALDLGSEAFTRIAIMGALKPFMRRIENVQLCEECFVSVEKAVGRFRCDLWQKLPLIFGLGNTWDDLQDF